MKQFLTRLFAVLGFLFTVTFMVGGLVAWNWVKKMEEPPKAPESMVLALEFDNDIVEQIEDYRFSLARLMQEGEEETPLIVMLRAIEFAKNDPKVKGIAAHIGSEAPYLAHAQEITAALDKFRESGKFTYIYGATYGEFSQGSNIYYLASHFENIWLQPIGSVALTPLAIEAPFGKTALEKIGVKTDFMRREDYKSVMENISRDAFSPAVKENMASMQASLNDQIAQGIALGRKIDFAKAKEVIANGPYTTNEASKLGLVTKVAYWDQYLDEIKEKTNKDITFVDPSTYMYYVAHSFKDEPKAKIAVIYADGLITDSAKKGPSRLARDESIDTDEIVEAFEDAAENDQIKAILFRVNSPGGSPVASETIRRAVIKAKEKNKPVYVSMGRVAASGGYWISMNADRIIANPATLTGSIGVVAGKFVFGDLLDKLGVKWDTIAAEGNTNMWSTRAPFSDKGRERMNTMLDETYKAFTDNVAAARKIPPEKIGDVTKGRVFTGEQAIAAGLVDELGGMQTAVESLKKHLKLQPEDRISLRQFPEPETPATFIFRLLQRVGFGASVLPGLLDQVDAAVSTLSPLLSEIEDQGRVTAKLPYFFSNVR